MMRGLLTGAPKNPYGIHPISVVHVFICIIIIITIVVIIIVVVVWRGPEPGIHSYSTSPVFSHVMLHDCQTSGLCCIICYHIILYYRLSGSLTVICVKAHVMYQLYYVCIYIYIHMYVYTHMHTHYII